MKRRFLILASFLLALNISAGQLAVSNVESDKVRRSIITAKSISVFEGLPHQSFEADMLARESKREDTTKIGLFRFYTPGVAAKNSAELKKILSSSDTIQAFGGEKLCGGFHPDYAVRWTDVNGDEFDAKICFGCREIIYSDGKNQYRYDLAAVPFSALQRELEAYKNKRPTK